MGCEARYGLLLDLVYNPVGAYLPPEQGAIEKQFKDELWTRHEIVFNRLYVITNMPINRFRHFRERAELYEFYERVKYRMSMLMQPSSIRGQ